MRCSTRAVRRPRVYTRTPFNGMFHEIMNAPVNELVRETRTVKTKPAVNIVENEEAFVIKMAIPGYTKDQISIKIQDGFLKIENKETANNEAKFNVKEFDYASFKRTFRLAKSIDINNTKAEMNQGILTLTLNKKEEQKLRTIEIS